MTPQPHTRNACRLTRIWFGLFPFRSPLLWESLLLSFPEGTEMFHFPPFALHDYVFIMQYLDMTRDRFPHSESSGSKPVSGSPKLIAAYHVLHRLPMPRHPPFALSSLTIKTFALSYILCKLERISQNNIQLSKIKNKI